MEKKEFLSVFSHEVRAHLGLVRNYAEILMMTPPKTRKQRLEFLRIIKEESEFLTAFLTDLVAMERIEQGWISWRISTVAPMLALQRAMIETAAEANEKRIIVKQEFADDLPFLSIDEHHLSRTFYHVLRNAIRFCRAGSTVHVRAAVSDPSPASGSLVVEFVDQGIGIQPKDAPRVFEKFFKGTTPVDGSPDGAGIGLSYARAVIENFQGRIELENRPEGGTCARIVLPLRSAMEPETRDRPPKPRPTAP